MKTILLAFTLVLPASLASAACVLQKEKDGQKLFNCQVPGLEKSIHVLDLKGGFSETAYYHGYFLQREIEEGVLKGVLVRTEQAFSQLSPRERSQIEVVRECAIDKYRSSVSDEFKSGLRHLYRGLRDAGTKLSWKDFETANYMVEFSIYAEALQRRLEEDPGKTKRKLFLSCAPYFIEDSFVRSLKKVAAGLQSIKMGCTGISASASASSEGALVHGRNFDTGLIGFYEPHQVVVINRQKNGLVSVGIASAGLHYAGGISGFNNAGLAVSLHELQSTGAQLKESKGSTDIAPYLLHSLLMKARTLDQAIALLRERKGFGAWTFLISDAKTDEAASIEMSGDRVAVARRSSHMYLGQSNHFLHPFTSAEGYEYSMNKTLETRARLAYVTRSLQEDYGRINPQWVIDRLAGHFDEWTGMRSFGRTTTKAYTAATHVMVPARQEWWMSLGETYPTNRSHFIGFRLTPQGSSPVEILGITKAHESEGLRNWYDSMKYYVTAYIANESDHETLAGLDRSLGLLEQAQDTAMRDRVYEFPYHFMWGRLKVARAALAMEKGQKQLALADLDEAQRKFQEILAQPSLNLHNYEKFQLALWQFRAESLKPSPLQDPASLTQTKKQAQSLLEQLIKQYPHQKALFDLRWNLNQKYQLPIVRDAEIHIETVE